MAHTFVPISLDHFVFREVLLSMILSSHIDDFTNIASGRAKNWQKVAYLRRNPSPSVKWKTIV